MENTKTDKIELSEDQASTVRIALRDNLSILEADLLEYVVHDYSKKIIKDQADKIVESKEILAIFYAA